MIPTPRFPLLALLCGLAVIHADPAAAQTAGVSRFDRAGLTAFTAGTEQNGCIVTGTQLFANDTRTQTTGSPDRSTSVYMELNQIDVCAGYVQLFRGQAFFVLPKGALSIQSNLNSASLVATVPLVDSISHTTIPTAVNLSWVQGTQTGQTNSFLQSPLITMEHTRTTDNFDAIVTGTIQTPTGQLTSFSAGQLRSEKKASLTVAHRVLPVPRRVPSQTAGTNSAAGLVADLTLVSYACPFTLVLVTAQTRQPGAPPSTNPQPSLSVQVAQYSCDTFETVFSAFIQTPLPEGVFNVARNLSTASLVTTVQAMDCTNGCNGNTVPLDLNLAWTATSSATKSRVQGSFVSSDGTHHTVDTGSFVDASVSGSIGTPFGIISVAGNSYDAEIGSQTSQSTWSVH